MRLKLLGARIIVAGIAIGVLCQIFAGWDHRLNNYGPLIMFILFAVGALVGLVGWIASAVQRRKKISD
jgi:hypothetical protein